MGNICEMRGGEREGGEEGEEGEGGRKERREREGERRGGRGRRGRGRKKGSTIMLAETLYLLHSFSPPSLSFSVSHTPQFFSLKDDVTV